MNRHRVKGYYACNVSDFLLVGCAIEQYTRTAGESLIVRLAAKLGRLRFIAGSKKNPLTAVWRKLKGLLSGSQLSTRFPVMSKREFQVALSRERARIARTNAPLVVLTVGFEGNGHAGTMTEKLRRALREVVRKRARRMDVVGEWDDGIGIILPDTPQSAAEIVVNDIERIFHNTIRKRVRWEGELPEVLCEVYHVTCEVRSEKDASENARN